jgi:hypothetical protein
VESVRGFGYRYRRPTSASPSRPADAP